MKKSKISFSTVWLAILAFIVLTPMPSLAESNIGVHNITGTMRVQTKIQKIDISVGKIARERSSVTAALRNLTKFAKGAEIWFGRLDKVNAQIRNAQKSKGEYRTFSPSQLNDVLQQLKSERAGILQLNGGATIVGRHYTSIDQLKSAYANISREKDDFNKKWRSLSDALAILDKKRDAASSQLEQHERRDLSWNKINVRILEEEIKDIEDIVNDNKLWCMSGISADVFGETVTRRQAMHMIKIEYLKELETTPGKKFNSKELAKRFIAQRDESDRIKGDRRKILLAKQLELQEVHRRINAEESHSIDISGCWVIFLADKDNPVVNITKSSVFGYVAHITRVGVLDHIGRGHLLFSVRPVNKIVFEGLEHGTDANGGETTSKLRLILSKDGGRMDYRSDDILTMGRCQ